VKKDFMFYLKKANLLRRIREKFFSHFFLKQWILLVAKGPKNEAPAWGQFVPFIPPSDRIWADPFVWERHGNYFIFYEERRYASELGHIACLTLDHDLNQIANSVVLEQPYHLSYPFIFEEEGQIYMIPETERNRTVELYRCTDFPNHWVFVKNLFTDIKAVDATLLNANGKWWLFANIREEGSSWNALHLFYAEHFLSSQWMPHPHNPIVRDIKSARPAGRIFLRDGQLIRPSQDCSVRYGYALNFNRICELTESNYSEVLTWSLKPPSQRKILGTHTWNESGGVIAIDALIRIPRRSTKTTLPAARTLAGV
jgi:hypothetical protein